MLPKSRGKKRISLENIPLGTEKDWRLRTTDLSPLQKILGLKKPKKTSQSRDSNNGKTGKSRSKQNSRLEEFAGRIFKTQNMMSQKEDIQAKKFPLGYYLPCTVGNRAGPWRNLHDSADFDSYLQQFGKHKHKLSLSQAGASGSGTEKFHRLMSKRRSTEKTPLGRLNFTCDLTQTLKNRSKSKSKSSKKSAGGSRGGDEEPDLMETLKSATTPMRPKSNSRGRKQQPTEQRKVSRSKGKATYEKLIAIYKQLSSIVENSSNADTKLKEISKLFDQYVKLVQKINNKRAEKADDIESETLKMSTKVLGYFSVDCKMNVDSYIYTRALAMQAKKVLEQFIDEEKEILSQYVPRFFATQKTQTLVDAVKMVREFASSMINENKLLTSYVKEHLDNQNVVEMVKKSLQDRPIKLEEPRVAIDINDLRRKLEESTRLGRKTDQSTKTQPRVTEDRHLPEEIPTRKQRERVAVDIASSSRQSDDSRAVDDDSNNPPISDMGNSAIMRFKSDEDYRVELDGRGERSTNNRSRPAGDKYSPTDLKSHKDSILSPGGLDSVTDGYTTPIAVKPEPKKPKAPEMPDFKNKLKLNLPKNKPEEGFHEEFMKNFEEFSLSWRMKILNEKNAKHYGLKTDI